MPVTVELPEALYRSLQELARKEGRPVSALVEDALEAFLDREALLSAWQSEFHEVVETIRGKVSEGIPPDQTERDIDQTVAEVRAARARRR